jgi:hypothetical protein
MADLEPVIADVLAKKPSTLIFYRQAREDGGVRTGIELGGSRIFERFEAPTEEYDPSLIWSIELRFRGESVPHSAEEARSWLLGQSEVVEEGLDRYAEHLRAGSDPTGDYPLTWSDFRQLPGDLTVEVACTAQRRVDALQLGSYLRSVAKNWESFVESLEPRTDWL